MRYCNSLVLSLALATCSCDFSKNYHACTPAIMEVPQLRKTFSVGTKVVVSAKGGWQRDALALVVAGPEPVTTRQGEDYFWWVEFVEPERDADNDGPYHQAQILSRYITPC